MEWTQYRELAQSTGFIFLVVILLWSLLAVIVYWAFTAGATSMGEEVKFKLIEDDKPVSHE